MEEERGEPDVSFPAADAAAAAAAWEGTGAAADALWSETNKNRDVNTGPLARPFARTAHSFACFGLLASLAPSAALIRSLARSLTRGKENF